MGTGDSPPARERLHTPLWTTEVYLRTLQAGVAGRGMPVFDQMWGLVLAFSHVQ